MKALQNKKNIVLLFILAALVLAMPLLVRISQGNPYVSGEETYYNLRMAQEVREKGILEKAVAKSNGNLSAAARMLGISRPQLAYRLKK